MDEEIKTPICKLCDKEYHEREADIDSWRMVEMINTEKPTLWVCPDCLFRMGYTQIFDDLIALQNACGLIREAGE